EQPARLREVLSRHEPEEQVLLGVLRRSVPVKLLEHLGNTPPWSDRPRVMARVVLNPRVPRALALRLGQALFWRDLADVATAPRHRDAGAHAPGGRAGADQLARQARPPARGGDARPAAPREGGGGRGPGSAGRGVMTRSPSGGFQGRTFGGSAT